MPAKLQFLPGWRQQQRGTIDRGGTVTIEYDKSRLSRCFASWRGAEVGDIVAHCRFHPGGDLVTGSVVAPVHERGIPDGIVIDHVAQSFDVSVPVDAAQIEMWFLNYSQASTRCEAWDSRFGQNYWFTVGGSPPRFPTPSVSYRTDAMIRPDIVNVVLQRATKVNAFVSTAVGGIQGTDLQTTLDVVACVQESRYGANGWIDLHVFDGRDALIHAETMGLVYTGIPSPQYGFSGVVYQGSVATPGSVSPRPDAQIVQFRVYYTVNYQLFTDGILHQLDLPEDALVGR